MELSFDIRGNLRPYEIIEISKEVFWETFVNSFNAESSRQRLFTNYEHYMDNLSKVLTKDFYQWIDGSYITTKQNPADIDLVTFIDHEDYESNKIQIEKEFASAAGRSKYGVDAYILADYPKSHKNYIFSHSDSLYWLSLFSRTRMNRAKKQYNKGIIRLNFRVDE